MRNDLDPFGIDLVVPTSPAHGWFDVYEDPATTGWNDLELGSSPFKSTTDAIQGIPPLPHATEEGDGQ